MKIIKQVSKDEVIQAWLQAEWALPNFDQIRSQFPLTLINGKNFDNQADNQLRFNILNALRKPMLDPLPPDTVWHIASFDKEDIQRTYVVPSNDWGTVSSNTYHPLKIMENLHLDDGHAKKINSIKATLSQNSIDTRLILVASSIDYILTLIEGNHRGVAIFMDAFEREIQNPIIDEVFVGISPTMKDYTFHMEKYLTSQTNTA